MNESSISIFIVQAALALFTFFVAAPCVLNAISTFTVQARLAARAATSAHWRRSPVPI